MGRINKEYEWRMQGMMAALKIAENEGIEALKKDIKNRGFWKLHISITEKDRQELLETMSRNLYTVFLCTVCETLNSKFGYGKKRLHQFKEEFDKVVQITTDFDWAGEHYVTLDDYARDLNRKYEIGIDEELCKERQYSTSMEREQRGKCKLKDVIDYLRTCDYEDAAKHLERLVD